MPRVKMRPSWWSAVVGWRGPALGPSGEEPPSNYIHSIAAVEVCPESDVGRTPESCRVSLPGIERNGLLQILVRHGSPEQVRSLCRIVARLGRFVCPQTLEDPIRRSSFTKADLPWW